MYEILTLARTDSTQTEVRRMLAERGDLAWGCTVRALTQTAGRGRLGRQWQSEGQDVLMWSTWLPLPAAPEAAPMLTLAAGLALADTLTVSVRLKWPNDIMTGEGRKLAGILAEAVFDGNSFRGAIVGIGLNLRWGEQGPPADLALTAATLAELGAFVRDGAQEVIEPWLKALDRRLRQLRNERDAFVADYNTRLLDGTRQVRLEGVDAAPVVGYIEGIDAEGGVWLRRADGAGRLRTTVGELSLIDRPLT